MTTTKDTTRAASRHDGEALPGDAAGAGLDAKAARLLRDTTADVAAVVQPMMLTPLEADPVYRIGAQLGRLVAQHSELDRAESAKDPEINKQRERVMARADNSGDLLREAITYQQATSLAGALAQVVVASQILSDSLEIDRSNEGFVEDRAQALRRCLFSIARAISASAGVSPRVFGSDYYMPQHFDRLANAWTEAQASYVPTTPSPTVADDSSCGAGSFVEQQLVEMNERAGVLWQLYEEAGRMDDENSHNPSNDKTKLARHKMGDMAEAHARRRWRELLRRAIALPAGSVRELGLQARLIAVELDEWWDQDDLEDGELACRVLLDRLAAFADMPRIERSDVEPAEIRDWLDRPEHHAPEYNPELRRPQA